MKCQLRFYCLFPLLIALCFALAACGSGGNSSPGRTSKATTSLKTAGLVPPGTRVATLDVIISIPYGVTVEVDPVTNEPVSSVVTLVGTTDPAMTMKTLDYIAATPSTNGSLRITYIAADGFTPSDSIAITLDIATGFFPVASDFSLTKFDIGTMAYTTDANGNTILNIYPIAPVPNPNSLLTVTVI